MTEPTNQGELAPTSPATPAHVTRAAEFAEPVAPVAAAPVRHPGPSPIRVGIVAAGLVAILGGAAITFAANKTASPAAGTTTAANTDSGVVLNVGGGVFEFGGGPGGPGFGRHGGFREITITAINGSNISLETADGWSRTITVDADTAYEKAGETIALGDLAVGDQVHFMQTLEDDGTYTIDALVVVLPHVGGEVTAISGSTITVEQRDGTSATINVTADTTYNVDGDEDAALADIEVGDFVVAEGTENSDGSLTASRVGSGHVHVHRGPGSNDNSTDDSSDTSTEG